MKFKTDIHGEIEIPEDMLKRFHTWCPENVTFVKIPECSKNCDACESFQDAFDEYALLELEEKEGKLISKEDAEFLVNYVTGIVPSGGGYPVEGYITFEDEGRKYTIIAFGWTSELNEKGPLHLVAYKEI